MSPFGFFFKTFNVHVWNYRGVFRCLYSYTNTKIPIRLRYFPLVAKGGEVIPMNWTPLQKTTFRVEFSDKKCTIDRVRQIIKVSKMKFIFLCFFLFLFVSFVLFVCFCFVLFFHAIYR